MWRVEDHEIKTLVRERQGLEVAEYVWLYPQDTPVAQRLLDPAVIAENGTWVVMVEPKHPAAATGVEDRLHAVASFSISAIARKIG